MILGIDPGLQYTGWAVINKTKDNKLSFVDCGTINTDPKSPMSIRLKKISDSLTEVFNSFTINEVSLEETFVNKNNLSSLKLGQARGAIILTIANFNFQINEYSATNVKKSITGAGRADKEQILTMTKILIPKANTKNDHEADALAIAICHANSSNLKKLHSTLKN